MFLSCKCLNITIKIRDNSELKPIKVINYHDNNFEPVLMQSSMPLISSATSTISTATLATVTPPKKIDGSKIAGEFFNHDLIGLITMASTINSYDIIKQQQPLIYDKVVDNWTINYCVNCMMYTHALNNKFNVQKNITNDDNDDNNEINNSDYNNYKLLINKNMILPTDNDINNSNDNVDYYEKLKLHVNYSKIYNIIINKNFDNLINNSDNNNDDNEDDDDNDDDEYNLILKKQLSNSLKLAVNHLQKQYELGYQNMKKQIDEKIQKFAAEQYEFLDIFKEHGHKEYRTLVNRIWKSDLMKIDDISVTDGDLNKFERKTELLTNQTVLSTNGSTLPPVESVLSAKLSTFSAPIPVLSTEKSLLSLEQSVLSTDWSVLPTEINKIENFEGIEQNGENSSILRYNKNEMENKIKRLKKKNSKILKNGEDEVIFPLEGMDDSDNGEISEEEIDTDDSGQDEGIHIPRGQRGGHPTLAKSLPVNVPNFSFGRRIQDSDDDQLSMDPRDPHNIRASIKALAKSVHGDTVFGDLPRPRFSTQI